MEGGVRREEGGGDGGGAIGSGKRMKRKEERGRQAKLLTHLFDSDSFL